ncbi:hypothetical protein NPS70_15260 [Streptomyces sp. C10-9-1]|uniref:hypothetical protein n=1 Tax=Streptomyces sp. C10-9-1 TaxID=1859285 RepID=UPI0021135043|nr:hypothetical protein [Streptomyces sp. C10-9-1]MCQ6554544.1 hypothetical protein [Streptomyces sp. C10-9-1]
MISEPELVGDEPFERPGDRPGAVGPGRPPEPDAGDTVTGGAGAPGGLRRRPAWWWAFGGALAASALWAVGLTAYQRLALDPGAYRAVEDLCERTELAGIREAVGPFEDRGQSESFSHVARDEASCIRSLRPVGYEVPVDEEGNELGSMPTLYVSYILHKGLDPEPEFESTVRARHEMWEPGTEVRELDGPGERAFVVAGASEITLDVLDGQAEVRLVLSGDIDYGTGEPLLDVSRLEGDLVDDVRALLDRLKADG